MQINLLATFVSILLFFTHNSLQRMQYMSDSSSRSSFDLHHWHKSRNKHHFQSAMEKRVRYHKKARKHQRHAHQHTDDEEDNGSNHIIDERMLDILRDKGLSEKLIQKIRGKPKSNKQNKRKKQRKQLDRSKSFAYRNQYSARKRTRETRNIYTSNSDQTPHYWQQKYSNRPAYHDRPVSSRKRLKKTRAHRYYSSDEENADEDAPLAEYSYDESSEMSDTENDLLGNHRPYYSIPPSIDRRAAIANDFEDSAQTTPAKKVKYVRRNLKKGTLDDPEFDIQTALRHKRELQRRRNQQLNSVYSSNLNTKSNASISRSKSKSKKTYGFALSKFKAEAQRQKQRQRQRLQPESDSYGLQRRRKKVINVPMPNTPTNLDSFDHRDAAAIKGNNRIVLKTSHSHKENLERLPSLKETMSERTLSSSQYFTPKRKNRNSRFAERQVLTSSMLYMYVSLRLLMSLKCVENCYHI